MDDWEVLPTGVLCNTGMIEFDEVGVHIDRLLPATTGAVAEFFRMSTATEVVVVSSKDLSSPSEELSSPSSSPTSILRFLGGDEDKNDIETVFGGALFGEAFFRLFPATAEVVEMSSSSSSEIRSSSSSSATSSFCFLAGGAFFVKAFFVKALFGEAFFGEDDVSLTEALRVRTSLRGRSSSESPFSSLSSCYSYSFLFS